MVLRRAAAWIGWGIALGATAAHADAAPPLARGAWPAVCAGLLERLAGELKATHPNLLVIPSTRKAGAATLVSIAFADRDWQAAVSVDDAGREALVAEEPGRGQAGPMRYSVRYPAGVDLHAKPESWPPDAARIRATARACMQAGVATGMAGLAGRDGRIAAVEGIYRATPVLRKGKPDPAAPREQAELELADGTRMLVEPYGSLAAARPAAERERLDGKRVIAAGIYRARPTAELQAPLNPALEAPRFAEEH